MREPRSAPALVLLFGLLAVPGICAGAPPPIIDGTLDPVYGPALVTQTTQTPTDDNQANTGGSNGSELDAGYGFVSNGVLYLMLTGNMLLGPNNIEPGTVWNPIHFFIDSKSGGQNTLLSDNDTLRTNSLYWASLHELSGLTFDTEFAPDYWLGCAGAGGPDFGEPYRLPIFYADLPSNAGGSVTYVGSARVGGLDTLSSDGSNPYGIAIALNNSNSAGVSQGCAASSGAGVSTGFEWAIPLAAIGNPTGPIKVCVLYNPYYSNQVLGPVPPGTCTLGIPSSVNFATVPGSQFFVVSPATLPVPPVTSSGLGLAPLSNPSAGLAVTYTLANEAPARLDVIDSSGRRVLARSLAGGAAGSHTLEIAREGELPPGVYFVRLSQGASRVTTPVVVTR